MATVEHIKNFHIILNAFLSYAPQKIPATFFIHYFLNTFGSFHLFVSTDTLFILHLGHYLSSLQTPCIHVCPFLALAAYLISLTFFLHALFQPHCAFLGMSNTPYSFTSRALNRLLLLARTIFSWILTRKVLQSYRFHCKYTLKENFP